MQTMSTEKAKGLVRIWNAFGYSLDGLKSTFEDEAAFRQELIMCLVLLPLAFYVPIPLTFKLLLISSMILVLIVELLNSAIEALTDLITKDFQILAKKAKDCGSAAVLGSLILSGCLWGVALYYWLIGF